MYRIVRPGAALALAIGIAVPLAACSGASQTTGDPAPTEQVTQPGAPAAPTAPDDGSAQAPASTAGTEPGQDPPKTDGLCTTAALHVTMTPEDAAAGSRYFTITFKNQGETSCHLNGHPGVSAVAGDKGEQLGKAAAHGAPDPGRVTLAPGDSAHATLKAVNIGDDGGPLAGRCKVESAAGWRIYPPDSKKSVFLRQADMRACGSDVEWLTVGSVTK
jgi:hypothetical protein